MFECTERGPCPFCREYGRTIMGSHYGKLCSRHFAECAVPARLYPTQREETAKKAAQKRFNLKPF